MTVLAALADLKQGQADLCLTMDRHRAETDAMRVAIVGRIELLQNELQTGEDDVTVHTG